jgi:SAM-dependent methyltransferase
MEIGYATAWGVPVYSDQIPSDITLRDFVNVVNSPAAALATATASPSLNYLSHVHQGVYDEVASEYDDRTTALEPVTQAAITELSEWLPTGASVLDVGCGAGLAVRVLAEAGFDAEGIDLSPEMVSYAKARNPDRRILTGDLLHTDLHRDYDAVLAFAFIHLFPKKDAPRVLARIWSILRPGGLLYIGTTDAEQSSEGFEGKGDYPDQPVRWRSHYTGDEMLSLLVASGYRVVATITHIDAFDKRWFDVIAARD